MPVTIDEAITRLTARKQNAEFHAQRVIDGGNPESAAVRGYLKDAEMCNLLIRAVEFYQERGGE